MPDAAFAHPRLAALYDPLDPVRGDLEVYADLLAGLGVRSVLDVGCGTGVFALVLAERGFDVVGVDPAGASLDLARAKPGADRVRWVHGDVTMLTPLAVDAATMTGNVAQLFVTDDEWATALGGVRGALRPGGWFVFETRVPARRAWEEWTREATWSRDDVAGVGVVETWLDVLSVDGPIVRFRATYRFEATGEELTSDSTLRFRTRTEVEASLDAAGFTVREVRDAPDRPGREHVFVAERAR
ncbi:MAG: class I SAM-dependent methyltransferase [Actinomycetota bacterium]|nr:class I SAM-dependent methyltransferase [Actinomycetota bacterium]